MGLTSETWGVKASTVSSLKTRFGLAVWMFLEVERGSLWPVFSIESQSQRGWPPGRLPHGSSVGFTGPGCRATGG